MFTHRSEYGGRVLGDTFHDTALDYAHNLTCALLHDLRQNGVRRFVDVELVLDLLRPARAKRATAARSPNTSITRILEYIRKQPGGVRAIRVGPDMGANVQLLADVLGLDATERAVLQFGACLQGSRRLREFCDAFGTVAKPGTATIVAAAIGASLASVHAALGAAGRLLSSGVMSVSAEACDLSDKLELKSGILDALMTPGLDRAGLLARFLPESAPCDLDWADIDHLQGAAGLARDILAAALRERRPGVNVLLYGETGTGKTQLARLLARDVSAKLFVAGRSDDDGESPSARERLSSLVLGHRQQLEAFRGIVACTTNLWQEIDEAALRRFTFAIEFGYLHPAQALLLFRHFFGSELGDASADDVTHVATVLAGVHNLTPGDFAAVARRHRVLGGPATVHGLGSELVAQARAKSRARHPLGFGA